MKHNHDSIMNSKRGKRVRKTLESVWQVCLEIVEHLFKVLGDWTFPWTTKGKGKENTHAPRNEQVASEEISLIRYARFT